MMERRLINAPDAPQSLGGYVQAVETIAATHILHISGQIPAAPDGSVPADFASQARLAWANIEAQLRAADMTLDNLVKVTTFLADRRHGVEYRQIRNEILAGRKIALTVVISGIFDEAWLLEIEAIAAA